MQEKRDSVSTTMRSRRVFYDDYTHNFYVESRLETLRRQVETRNNLTEVLNKSQTARCNYSKRQVDADMRIFLRQNAMATTMQKDNLVAYRAHYGVLQDIARRKQRDGALDEYLGRYGLGTAQNEIQELIEKKIKHNSPSAKRRRDTKKFLGTRTKVEVFDRTLATSALLKSDVKSRSTTKLGTYKAVRSSPQLVLPPIAVTFKKENGQKLGKGVHLLTRPATSGRYDDLGLPSVFVTQTSNTMYH